MSTVIKVENLSKQYRLGLVGANTFKEDTIRWWAKLRGKQDPFLNLGTENDRTSIDESKFVWSLRDVNFELNQGEVLGIIGRNGAGKSTLLKILSRVTAPTKGVVKINGRMASLLEVGTGFHPELTGRENVYLNGAILGMKKNEISTRLDEIISFAGVEKYVDTPVKRYSSGMYVRLAFAVAAHLETDILTVDEVLAVGDFEFQKKCIGKMKDVSKNGKSIIFVSHLIPSLQGLCTHGVVLKNGIIVSEKKDIESSIQYYLNESNNINYTPLLDRKDRKGSGVIKFIDYQLLDVDGNIINRMISGQVVKIRLYYQKNLLEEIKNVSVSLSITSSKGVLISVFCNDYIGKHFNIISNKGYFECKVHKLPLMEDSYSVNLMINKSDDIFDWLENAFSIDVENGDYFNSGKIIEQTHKSIMIDHDWSYKKD